MSTVNKDTGLPGIQKEIVPEGPIERRIRIVDRLRGLAMILMLLDHARTFLVNTGFHPLDPEKTNLFLYLTRWITHPAAVAFVFLAGVAAQLRLEKTGSSKGMAGYLLKRGLWLVFLELTIVSFLWRFRLGPVFTFQVIGVLGVSMVFLAGLQYLPRRIVLVLAVVILAGHNLLDTIPVSEIPTEQGLFKFLHVYGEVSLGSTLSLRIAYPLLPWLGLMLLGFSLGSVFAREDGRLRKRLLIGGGVLLVLFFLVRLAGGYGNLYFWQELDTPLKTLFSFFYCAKYPPSLSFMLIILGTLGVVGFLFLRVKGKAAEWVLSRMEVFGRVPLFFYLVHLLLLHLSAYILFALIMGDRVINVFDDPEQIGFPVWAAWVVFFLSTVVLFYVSRSWDRFRKAKPWRHLL